MRSIVDFLVAIYLLPLRLSKRLAIYAKGKILQFDEHYVATIAVAKREFGASKGIIIDVGAYDADSTVVLAGAFPDTQVHAFEPNPVPFRLAEQKSKAFRNIHLYNIGLSDVEGSCDFYVSEDAVSSSVLAPDSSFESSLKAKIKVNVTTMDKMFSATESILLIKLDTQGLELRILQGANITLDKTCLVLLEMLNSDLYVDNCQYHEVDQLMRDQGFRLHTLFSNFNNDGLKYYDALYINNRLRKS